MGRLGENYRSAGRAAGAPRGDAQLGDGRGLSVGAVPPVRDRHSCSKQAAASLNFQVWPTRRELSRLQRVVIIP